MAIVVTNLTNGFSETPGTTFNTASHNPAAGSVGLLAIAAAGGTADLASPPTVTGQSRTWTFVNGIELEADWTLYVFRGVGEPSSGAIQIVFSGGGCDACAWSSEEVAGANTTTPVVQSGTATETGSTITVNLSAFGSATNGAYAAVIDEEGEVTPGTGFSQLTDITVFFNSQLYTQWRADEDTSVDASGFTNNAVMVALEIAEAAGGDPPITDGPKLHQVRSNIRLN